MSRADSIALLLSALAILAGYLVADRVYERMAHIEDEMAYLWQAQAIAEGNLSLPSPPEPESFLVPFVVDYNGRRFGKYPLGWPVLLAIGIRLGIRSLINPLLGGLGVWLTYRLGKFVFGETVGLLGALLMLISPFFLMNSGSLLSHPLGLVLSTAFSLAWLDATDDSRSPPAWLPLLVAAGCLGTLTLTRPLTAIAVGIPFGIHGLVLLIRRDGETRRRLIIAALIILVFASLHLVWQTALTGDPLLNPYTLWWDYDRVGFGPGIGHTPEGHTLWQARINTRFSLWVGYRDLFGWGAYSWLFLPVGLLVLWCNRRGVLPVLVFPSLVIVYLAYWIGSHLFGPRYYYEGLFSLTLLSGTGIALLAGWPIKPGIPFPSFKGWKRIRPLGMVALLSILLAISLIFYTPQRLHMMYGLYGVQRSHLEPFLTTSAQELTPALVIVHTSGKWIEYGTLLELETPYLDTPFIFAVSRGEDADARIPPHFPERRVFHYYSDDPFVLYTAPRP